MNLSTGGTAIGVISAMITPALLILGSGSLVASALMRLGRSVDRARVLIAAIESGAQMPFPNAMLAGWLDRLERRSLYAEHAIALFFAAVFVFVTDCLTIAVDRGLGGSIAWLPIGLTILGMILVLAGAGYMLAESRLGGAQVREEIARGLELIAQDAQTARTNVGSGGLR